MRIGQTSFVVFVSKLLSAAVGFSTTLYFARVLGAEIPGIYVAILALVMWLSIAGSIDVGSGLTKRISEEDEQGEYIGAGVIIILALTLVVGIGAVVIRPYLDI
jgi:O-antigen/teichoic acid export membrane protein